MTGCSCNSLEPQKIEQQRALRIALILNGLMFVVGTVAGVLAQSSGLMADALDMFADALAYVIALMAMTRGPVFKAYAARVSGTVLAILGVGILLDVVRRGFFGSSPESLVIMSVATLSLCVNASVLYLLARHQAKREIHLRATYIFTRADVIANLAVILSGAIMLFPGFRFVDLIVGTAIGAYIIWEAAEIFQLPHTVSGD